MRPAIALITLPESRLGAALAAQVEARDFPCHVLCLDAPLLGRAVTVRPGHVTWEGVELLDAGAVLLEQPTFPWPQTLQAEALPVSPEGQQQQAMTERDARSLIVSSLAIVAERRPVANPPEGAHLAASPAVALLRASRAGLPVQPWRLSVVPAQPARDPAPGWWVVDVVGAERWHRSLPVQAGDRCLCLRIPDVPVQTLLAIGERTIVAIRSLDPSARGWGGPGPGARACTADERAAALAQRVLSCLGLQFAAVDVTLESDTPRLLAVDAAPDLAAWDQLAGGAVCPALADHLIQLSAVAEGAAR